MFVDDESEGKAETRAFLDRRIDGVMKFEKAKARLLTEREGFSVARFLGGCATRRAETYCEPVAISRCIWHRCA